MKPFLIIGLLTLFSISLVLAQPGVQEQPPATEQPATENAIPAEPMPIQPPLETAPGTYIPRPDLRAGMRAPAGASVVPGRTISLDVRNLDIDHVLKLLGDAAGLTIAKDPAVTGPVTIISSKLVSIDEAFEILNAVLNVRGYTTVRQGSVLKVVALDKAMPMITETHTGSDPSKVVPGDRLITQIVPLATLDANQVASQLAPLAMTDTSLLPNPSTNTLYITDTASNVQRLLGIIEDMEKRNTVSIRVFRLQYVGAYDMSDLILQVMGGAAGGTTAPAFEQRVLQGRGPQNVPGRPRPMLAQSSGGASGVQVIPDSRTNSLIVLANPERLDQIGKFLAEFDRPVDYLSTIAVITLQHARADDVADYLSQAIGGAKAASSQRSQPQSPFVGSQQTEGARSNASSRARLQSGTADSGASAIPALASPDNAPNLTLAQAQTGQPSEMTQGRTEEGRIVPLVDTQDITIIPVPSTNSIIINAAPEKLELVRAIVNQLDVIPTQVLIKAIIVEVSLSRETKLGIEFLFKDANLFGHSGVQSSLSNKFGLQPTDSEGALVEPSALSGLTWSVLRANDFSALLNTLATNANARILSAPNVFTTSGKLATINVSTSVPYISGTVTSNVGGAVTATVEYVDVGIVLKVLPIVSQDGTVAMEVSQTANDLLRLQTVAPGQQAPTIAKRLAEATIYAQDGETVILGGLMSDRTTTNISGIPYLKDLPLIGWIFRSRSAVKEKSELLVFLTPQVIRSPEESRLLTEQMKNQNKEMRKIPLPSNASER